MLKTIQGHYQVRGKHFGIVISRFNEFITQRLLQGCLQELRRHNIKDNQITIVWVPGSFEIPIVALKLAKRKSIDVVICLGAVIRGETIHFDLVAQAAATGILKASLITEKPIIFGVITTDNVSQAYQRSKKKGPNKGQDAAQAALEMISVF